MRTVLGIIFSKEKNPVLRLGGSQEFKNSRLFGRFSQARSQIFKSSFLEIFLLHFIFIFKGFEYIFSHL
jgi:hypothetical protein